MEDEAARVMDTRPAAGRINRRGRVQPVGADAQPARGFFKRRHRILLHGADMAAAASGRERLVTLWRKKK